MSSINRLQEMAGGAQGLNSWRLRDLKEEKQLETKKALSEHTEALALVQRKLDKGDIAGAVDLLTAVQEKIGKTIESLK